MEAIASKLTNDVIDIQEEIKLGYTRDSHGNLLNKDGQFINM